MFYWSNFYKSPYIGHPIKHTHLWGAVEKCPYIGSLQSREGKKSQKIITNIPFLKFIYKKKNDNVIGNI